ncbi:NAD-binding protein [Lentzea sp. NBC_00516]|uniref:NAD-binding protein n=1 Tax=Lentzea sp. NBC_00516 TaxID=2903582 RepID=UPI002E820D71|nr:NAD-binding protein [Lentzea sp. NBC_00516]WUD28465.1 NAD-binding protein [Lentzea sp. NBC_00516]
MEIAAFDLLKKVVRMAATTQVIAGGKAVKGSGKSQKSRRLLALESFTTGAHTADHVVVAVLDVHESQRITAVARSVNDDATIIAVVHGSETHETVDYPGVDHVVNGCQVAEWVPDLPEPQSNGSAFADDEWSVAERAVTNDEVGRSPLDCAQQVLAVLRHGRRRRVEDPAVAVLRDDDRLLVVSRERPVPDLTPTRAAAEEA